ncbi:MAG TPA: histidine phosphatase family protein [Chlorobaculum sp.]|nr:histidine phosphatase family protein [Chlorobaculum sp.]
MKTIYLVRHAKAGWENSLTADFDRSLSDRGIKDAREMSRHLLYKGIVPELIVSSPAKRALTTAEIFADTLASNPEEIVQRVEIYQGGPDELAEIVQSLPEECRTVMLFGHNPVISMFASWLAGKSMASMETCGIVCIELGKTKWKDAGRKKGTVLWYDYPGRHQ